VNAERTASAVGVGAAVVVLVLTVVPFGVAGPTARGAYYGVGFASPVFVSLLAIVGAITLVSATTGRSDPALAAGIAVTVAAFAVVLSVLWALPAREVALGVDPGGGALPGAASWFPYHPHAVVLAALALAGAAGLHARTVL